MIDTAVIGYLAKNWVELNSEAPAIIVNPSASPLDVLAWCWGEVECLHQAADACAAAGESIDSEALGAMFLHRLAPLSHLMRDAIQALVNAKKQGVAVRMQGE